MATTLPPDIYAKLNWAKSVLGILREQSEQYSARYPVRVRATQGAQQPDGNYEWYAESYVHEQPPIEISLLAGDIAQNLRASLDYLAHALVLATGGTPTYGPGGTQFPILTSPKQPRLSGCSDPEVLRRLAAFQPSTAAVPSAHPLARLNDLNNLGKHTAIPVIAAGGAIPAVMSMRAIGASDHILVVPYLRWFLDHDRLDPLTMVLPAGVEPVVDASIGAVVRFDPDPWNTISVVDELTFLRDYVAGTVVPAFRASFDDGWPAAIPDEPSFDPMLELAISPDDFREVLRNHVRMLTEQFPGTLIAIMNMLPGMSAAKGFEVGGAPRNVPWKGYGAR